MKLALEPRPFNPKAHRTALVALVHTQLCLFIVGVWAPKTVLDPRKAVEEYLWHGRVRAVTALCLTRSRARLCAGLSLGAAGGSLWLRYGACGRGDSDC